MCVCVHVSFYNFSFIVPSYSLGYLFLLGSLGWYPVQTELVVYALQCLTGKVVIIECMYEHACTFAYVLCIYVCVCV